MKIRNLEEVNYQPQTSRTENESVDVNTSPNKSQETTRLKSQSYDDNKTLNKECCVLDMVQHCTFAPDLDSSNMSIDNNPCAVLDQSQFDASPCVECALDSNSDVGVGSDHILSETEAAIPTQSASVDLSQSSLECLLEMLIQRGKPRSLCSM